MSWSTAYFPLPTAIFLTAVAILELTGNSALADQPAAPKASNVTELTPDNFDQLVIRGKYVWIVKFYTPWCGHCAHFAPEVEKAATALQGIIRVGRLNCDDYKDFAKKFRVNGYPTVKIFDNSLEEPVDFRSSRTAIALIEAALDVLEEKIQYQYENAVDVEPEKPQPKAKSPPAGAGSDVASKPSKHQNTAADVRDQEEGDVIVLTDSNFDEVVLKSKDMWLVKFFTPWCGHCKNLAPAWIEAAAKLSGKVKVAEFDCNFERGIPTRYEVRGYPTIKAFAAGEKTEKSVMGYNGGRSADEIVEWAIKMLVRSMTVLDESQIKNKTYQNVIKLTKFSLTSMVLNSKDPWLVEYFAPWCVHCKNLEPIWEDVAMKLKGLVKLGSIDCSGDKKFAEENNITVLPTIRSYLPKTKSLSDFKNFTGLRTADSIITWAMSMLQDGSKPPPKLHQLTSTDVFLEQCDSTDHKLCLVSFLPDRSSCDSKCRSSYIQLISKLSVDFRQEEWGWVWSEGGVQRDLETSMRMRGFKLPILVVVNVKKLIYSIHKGAFSFGAISEFLSNLSGGKRIIVSFPFEGETLPEIETIEACDDQGKSKKHDVVEPEEPSEESPSDSEPSDKSEF